MQLKMPYGETKLALHLPENLHISVIEPQHTPGLADPRAAIRAALNAPINMPPLKDLARPEDRVGIIFSDITRPTPNWLILPVVLEALSHLPPENITLFNALGTHRENSPEEMRTMLGDDLVDRFRIVQNAPFDQSTQVCLGTSSFGHEIWINRELMDCDLKILTGFIEPHFFAGFSGGGKAIMPGMAGTTTIYGNHSAPMISSAQADWGITDGNPIYEEINEIVDHVENHFLLNVTLNKNKEITRVFCGERRAAHRAGCSFIKKTAMAPVSAPSDIVITTNSGYPLDQNLYQSVKGLSAAAKIVRPNGALILAAECRDGLPDHGLYGELLRSYTTPQEMLDSILAFPEVKQDQWQAQIQAKIQLKAAVYVHSDGLTNQQILSAMMIPTKNIEETVNHLVAKYGPQTRISILPEGPQTIPYLLDD